jgi:hypothetical protein
LRAAALLLVLETARVVGLVGRWVVMARRRPGKGLVVVVVVVGVAAAAGQEDAARQALALLLLLSQIVAASARRVGVDPLERGAAVIAMGAPLRAAQTGAAAVAVARSVVPLPFALHQTATATAHGQHLETLSDQQQI